MIRIGFDIGGTFTDIVIQHADTQKYIFLKVPTSTGKPAKAVAEGLALVLEQTNIAAGDVEVLLHATTIATNAILERKGSLTGLVTTKGFRDILLIGRQKRYNTYDLYLDKPESLVQRRHIVEVTERIDAEGKVVRELDLASVDTAIDALLEAGVESVAVALLHAYANPDHERKIRDRLLARAPDLSVSISSDVSAKIREYERASTTAANAYVKPIVSEYLDELRSAVVGLGLPPDVYIMQSNGGLVTPELASHYPVRIIESGPAAGVLMAAATGRQEQSSHVLTFDMGGTTAKLGAVDNYEPIITQGFEVDSRHFRKHSGLPLNIPAIELLEIGAGGGSLAATDLGLIQVGPKSASAFPGPICYGRGGTQPTVTDANLVLGYLNPAYFNAGAMKLDLEGARDGIRAHLAEPLGLSIEEAAWGVHAVANANMETAMRVISVERGRDPRIHSLVAFGGAGPLHAARLARSIGIPKVIIPVGAGVGSAIGLLNADFRIDTSLTRILPLEANAVGRIIEVYDTLNRQAQTELERLQTNATIEWTRYAYLRYVGQGFEIKVDLPDGPIDQTYLAKVRAAFYKSYEKIYGYVDEDASIEGIDWQLVARIPAKTYTGVATAIEVDAEPITGKRPAYFPETGGYVDCAVISRSAIRPGHRFEGPAIVEEGESTTIVLAGDSVEVSTNGNLIIHIAAKV
jgi:N-methylhydantoinase A